MKSLWKKVEKRLSSINLTLLLLLLMIPVLRGGEVPCEAVAQAVLGVGVESLGIGVEEYVPEGPPLVSKLVIQLQDGQTVRILDNGAVSVQEAPAERGRGQEDAQVLIK
jgi:hypothetical protein